MRQEKSQKVSKKSRKKAHYSERCWPGFDFTKWNRARTVASMADVKAEKTLSSFENCSLEWVDMNILAVKGELKVDKIKGLLSKVGI